MKNKDRPNYKEMSEDKLNDLIKNINLQIMKSHTFHKDSKVKAEMRTELRKEIARIKTELSARKKNAKEEKNET